MRIDCNADGTMDLYLTDPDTDDIDQFAYGVTGPVVITCYD